MTPLRFGRHRTRSTAQQLAAVTQQLAAADATEQGAALAGEMRDIIIHIGGLLDGTADWAENQIAGGAPPRWVVQCLIYWERLIADAARPERPAQVTR